MRVVTVHRGSQFVEYDPARDSNPYEAAVREWVARRLRTKRGHVTYTRHQIRNVRFGVDGGWGGTEVTLGDPDFAVVRFEKQAAKVGGGWSATDWRTDYVALDESPVDLIAACLAIAKELFIP